MDEKKFLYCPNKINGKECCKKLCHIGTGKFHKDIQIKCRKCGKLIKYHSANETTEIREVPKRTQESGMRFY